jgi:hypothetical protein
LRKQRMKRYFGCRCDVSELYSTVTIEAVMGLRTLYIKPFLQYCSTKNLLRQAQQMQACDLKQVDYLRRIATSHYVDYGRPIGTTLSVIAVPIRILQL